MASFSFERYVLVRQVGYVDADSQQEAEEIVNTDLGFDAFLDITNEYPEEVTEVIHVLPEFPEELEDESPEESYQEEYDQDFEDTIRQYRSKLDD